MAENSKHEIEEVATEKIVIKNLQKERTNRVAFVGFLLAILTILLGWISTFGWVIWALGLALSLAGMFEKPIKFAIAGIIFSLIGLVLLLFVFTMIM